MRTIKKDGTMWNRVRAVFVALLMAAGLGVVSVSTAAPASASIVTNRYQFTCTSAGTPGTDTQMVVDFTYRFDTANDRMRAERVYAYTLNDVEGETWHVEKVYKGVLRITYGQPKFPAFHIHNTTTVDPLLVEAGSTVTFILETGGTAGVTRCGHTARLETSGGMTTVSKFT